MGDGGLRLFIGLVNSEVSEVGEDFFFPPALLRLLWYRLTICSIRYVWKYAIFYFLTL